MNPTGPIYDRAPSKEFLDLLSSRGFLSPLVKLKSLEVRGFHHDVHFRSGDEAHVYRGLTRLITATGISDDGVRLTAHPTYRSQPCAQNFLRRWHIAEPGFSEELHRYLAAVNVSPSFLNDEGRVQELWPRIDSPWVPFDREGVLGGPHQMGRDFPEVDSAWDELIAFSMQEGWPQPTVRGREVDQLAIDREGRLVLLELKDASKPTGEVYYSPFQLLQYVWEWHSALETVRNALQSILDARVAVGLTPADIARFTSGIRAAVGFGADLRSAEVRRRYEAVLEIVNRHLPGDVGPIETWAYAENGPVHVPDPGPVHEK